MPRYVVKDTFYKKAKKEGYRARSAYKLEEIQNRFHVIRKGDNVLDLGAAPGSWLQLESVLVGDHGKVIGLDILPIAPLAAKNAVMKKADIREIDLSTLLDEFSIPSFDVVTSDIAPNLSGIREVDDANIHELYDAVVRVVREGLRKGGNFLIKLFFSPDFKDMASDLKPFFSKVITFKPQASRGVSSEIYLVCLGKR
ncbi:MAG: Ribosomal RNA large subunit methyltransferase E [Syntrophorhabdaceae bacterium PtaU1.Bin034]|jgi:23S rRNA (uridine2552-2'-O)-methyltransferase|nr:MAG: Ribosomal RNA large subunit methyltransferase E [Syntrophorhabdaceae bacterium PtaU1.Bin034]